MKTMKKYLSIAALALVGAVMTGCSNNDNAVLPVSYDNVQQPVNNEKIVTLKTTISLDNNKATTRALAVDFDQKKAIKTFAAGDQIAVFYKDGSNNLRLATSDALTNDDIHNDGKTANFTITCPEPGEGAAVRYVYPASMAKGTFQATDEITDANTIDYSRLENQTGSLYDLGRNCDLATFDGNFSGTSLPASAPLTNRLAILALTLKNSDGSNITSGLSNVNVIGSNSKTYAVAVTGGMYSFGTDTIYVAIQPEDDGTALKIAAQGSNRYGKTLTARAYLADNFYNMSMRMLPTISIVTDPTVGQVIGDNGNIYNPGDVPSTVTAVAVIAYVGIETGHDTYKNGLAIALSDEGQMDWSTAKTTCAAHTPVFSNGTWVLPSSYQWSQMFRANGGSSTTWSGLDTTIKNANGTSLSSGKYSPVFNYWTSTNYNASMAWEAIFKETGVSDGTADKTNNCYVRACLVF